MTMLNLIFQNVKVLAQNHMIVQNINLHMHCGKQYALYARNGTGKTSFMLSFFKKKGYHLEGDISLSCGKYSEMNTLDLAKNGIFLIQQSPVDLPAISYAKIWEYMNKGKKNDFSKQLLKYDIPSYLTNKPMNICSSGERKIMEVFSMLLFKVKILFCDEVDSGMDSFFKDTAIRILKSVCDNGASVLIVSHDKSFLKKLSLEQSFTIDNTEWKCIQL